MRFSSNQGPESGKGLPDQRGILPSVPMNRSRALLLPTAIFCLLISGAAGLVYQVAWMRYLALFLGHTSYAVVAVLVAFMGGLALGNALLGAVADRAARPVGLYGRGGIAVGRSR